MNQSYGEYRDAQLREYFGKSWAELDREARKPNAGWSLEMRTLLEDIELCTYPLCDTLIKELVFHFEKLKK